MIQDSFMIIIICKYCIRLLPEDANKTQCSSFWDIDLFVKFMFLEIETLKEAN